MSVEQELATARRKYEAHFAEAPTHCTLNTEAWRDLVTSSTFLYGDPFCSTPTRYMGMELDHSPRQATRVLATGPADKRERMAKVKRYCLAFADAYGHGAHMEEDPDGEYVHEADAQGFEGAPRYSIQFMDKYQHGAHLAPDKDGGWIHIDDVPAWAWPYEEEE